GETELALAGQTDDLAEALSPSFRELRKLLVQSGRKEDRGLLRELHNHLRIWRLGLKVDRVKPSLDHGEAVARRATGGLVSPRSLTPRAETPPPRARPRAARSGATTRAGRAPRPPRAARPPRAPGSRPRRCRRARARTFDRCARRV